MEAETAFWLLSATAQSAAALAGLSALLFVFQLRAAGQGWSQLEKETNPTLRAITAKAWADIIRYSGAATLSFLSAVAFSLGALSVVEPSAAEVPILISLLAVLALSLNVDWGSHDDPRGSFANFLHYSGSPGPLQGNDT